MTTTLDQGTDRRGAERRHLTVLFCDLVGSTAMSSRLDPEEFNEIIGAYRRCCVEVIGPARGFIAQYLGDGVLVYFGYPRASEDDAERAVSAGLALVEAVSKQLDDAGAPMQSRVGIASGLVLVGDLVAEGLPHEHDVVGETPNLAARLQSYARAQHRHYQRGNPPPHRRTFRVPARSATFRSRALRRLYGPGGSSAQIQPSAASGRCARRARRSSIACWRPT